MRIRHFGLLANRARAKNLTTCRRLLATPLSSAVPLVTDAAPPQPCCPACGRGRLINGPNLSPEQLRQVILRLDSS